MLKKYGFWIMIMNLLVQKLIQIQMNLKEIKQTQVNLKMMMNKKWKKKYNILDMIY